MKDIIVRGSAVVTPWGNVQETTNRLFAGDSHVSATTLFDLPVSVAPFDSEELRNPTVLAEKLKEELPSFTAAEETLFIFAAAKGDLSSIEHDNEDSRKSLLSYQADQFAKLLNCSGGDILTISNACASGTAAIDTARDYLTSGLYDRVIIAGYDQICEFTVTGFHSLSAISPTGARPFDGERNGMSLGEGAGVIILEAGGIVPGDIVLKGTATSNDANHRTGPSRDGSGLAAALQGAINFSGISPNEIGAVKCHGTATPYNDAMEAKALYTVFGDNQPPVVSLKGALGHLSGAGSIVESVLALEFLKRKKIPGTAGFVSSDLPEPVAVANSNQSFDSSYIAVLAAGFGGLNSAVIFQEAK